MSASRIGPVASIALTIAAIIVDALQALISLLVFIPLFGIPLAFLAGKIVDILAFLGFGIWFSDLGICLMREYPLQYLGTITLENIPVLNVVPGWWFFVTSIIASERMRAEESSDEV